MNVKGRVYKKIFKKEKGVSEVLGSILVLLITVMLFSTVFYYVGTMPTPQPKIYAQFDATLHIVPNGAGGYCLNITVRNVGGESLVDWRTMFIVVIDFTAKQHMLSEPHFSKQPFDKDGKFSQGESFYYNSSWDNFMWKNKTVIKNFNIGITLMDKNTGSIIWSSKLQGRTSLPPVLVGVTTTPSIPILGKPATFKAIIFNPNTGGDVGTYNVTLDFSQTILKYSIEGSPIKPMNYSGNNAFTTIVRFKTNDSLNILRPYKVKVWVNNGYSNISYSTNIYVSRGTGNKNPDLYIDSKLVTLSTLSPTHGDNVQVSVTVENLGGTGAKFQLRVLDQYPGYRSASNPSGEITIKTNLGSSEYLPDRDTTYTIAAAGQTTISFIWEDVGANSQGNNVVSKVSGTHHLIFQIINITPVENPNKYPDTASISLTVLPSILLVDDDGYAEGSPWDTSRYYKYYLDTAGYKYTVDKSSIDIGQLKRDVDSHDLVIWETGYRENPITSGQASILEDFVFNKGGSLWLISQEISQGNLRTILGDNSLATGSINMENIKGVENPAINLTLSNGSLIMDDLMNRDHAPNGNDTIYLSKIGSYNAFIEAKEEGSTGNQYSPVGIYKDSSSTGGGKIVYLGFELSRVKHYYAQDFIAYRILKWLANISGRAGNDLAVEDMLIEPKNPLYKEPVHISVIVSNNGGTALSSEVLLEVDGVPSLNINTTNPNSTGVIPPDGGFVVVNFTWIPTQTGKHVLTAIVDPYNTIEETNEENNVINTEIVDTNVFVHYSTLIVYNSSQTKSINEKNALVVTLQHLGYRYKVLDSHSANLPYGYDDGTYFAQYNLVIWADGKIGKGDIKAIIDSMSNNPNTGQLFIGNDIMAYIDHSSKLRNYLEITSINSVNVNEKSVIYGINNVKSETNGMTLILQSTTMYNITATGAQGLFHLTKSTNTGYMTLEKLASQYSNTIPAYGYGIVSKTPVSGSKFGIIPFKLEDIAGIFGLKAANIAKPYDPAPQGQAWLMYHLFRWFGYVKDTPEFATFSSDIQIIYGGNNPNLPPIIGRSYMLRTKVYNYGSVGASAVVRFYDDYEWLGSKTVYVPANNYAQVEIQWTPMFAGKARHIRVIVDPLNEVQETQWNGTPYAGKEIFNFNNEAIITRTVYYFWDNMENGAGNWVHQATILDINGESPLDFVNRKDVSTNVIGDWDWSLSGDTDSSGNYHQDENTFYTNDTKVLDFTGGAHHSAPNAFWMPEAPRINKRKPIDVIFVIDTSGSMTKNYLTLNGKKVTRLYAAQVATMDAISKLSSIDRVAIYAFDPQYDWWGDYLGTQPIQILPFTPVTSSNYYTIKTAVWDDLNNTAGGGTPLYDTIAAAVKYMDNSGRVDAIKGIVVLTDGLSNSDYNYYKYAPGTGSYEEEPGPVQYYTDGNGLLKIPYSMLTISIAPNGWDGRLSALGNSSTGKVSMALFDSNGDHIRDVFSVFISLLQQASTGGLTAINPEYNNKLGATIISNLGVVVFSDGFRAYASDGGTGTPDDANTPGFLGKWKQTGFTIFSTNDGHKFYKSQSASEWINKYWVAETDTNGAYLTHMIYPKDVLDNHYPGTYSINSAYLQFWVGREKGKGYPDATLKIYADGQPIKTLKDVLKSGKEKYYTIQINLPPASLLSPYTINITVSSTKAPIAIDDVIVVYYIDYTPPTSNSGGGGTIPSDYSSVVNTATNYTYLITPPVDVSGAQKVLLSFWTKYWMTQGTNGGIMYLWGSNDKTSWTWDQTHRYYIMPSQSYTGNLDPRYFDSNWANNVITRGGPVINGHQNGMADATYTGSGTTGLPMWCFNGRSGSGTFGWDYIEVDLTHYLQESGFKYIRIVFMLVQFGGVGPNSGWNPAMGWYLDDVKISVTSDGNRDLWQLHNFGGTGAEKAHSGDYAWAYGDSNSNWALPKGVDSSLITKQIDLTNARTARLSFWIRFNLNPAAGVPPATVRVEVSDDNGMTWQSITYGVRIGWGASGTGGMAGTSANNNYGWVNSGTLARINCDLSGWAGKSIMIRFRVVTNNTDYPTYANSNDPYGVFIDDVVVSGEGYASTIPVSQSDYLWDGGTLTNVKPPHKIPNKQGNNIKDKNIEINIHLRGERPDHHHVGPIEMMHALPIIQPFLIRIAVVRNF